MHQITIEWKGPLTVKQVIDECDDGGRPPRYDGEDYGLYQIYGRHILDRRGTPSYRSLLYIGEATEQTFASRFRSHQRTWLKHEWEKSLTVHVGRFQGRYGTDREWKVDVLLAERILIYTYSPHYNSSAIADCPRLGRHGEVTVVHVGKRGRLFKRDVVPAAWK